MKESPVLLVPLVWESTHLRAGCIYFDDQYLQVSWLNGKMLEIFEMILPLVPLHSTGKHLDYLPSKFVGSRTYVAQ